MSKVEEGIEAELKKEEFDDKLHEDGAAVESEPQPGRPQPAMPQHHRQSMQPTKRLLCREVSVRMDVSLAHGTDRMRPHRGESDGSHLLIAPFGPPASAQVEAAGAEDHKVLEGGGDDSRYELAMCEGTRGSLERADCEGDCEHAPVHGGPCDCRAHRKRAGGGRGTKRAAGEDSCGRRARWEGEWRQGEFRGGKRGGGLGGGVESVGGGGEVGRGGGAGRGGAMAVGVRALMEIS